MKHVLLFVVILALSACARSSSYLLDRPLVLVPDRAPHSDNIQERSTAAFLKALQRYGWQIRGLDREEGTIIAEACRGTRHCAEIAATVMEDGSVSIIRTPERTLTIDEGNILRGWVSNLEREYKKNMRRMR
ncbi:MAG: hypothetical protein V2I36_10255 [Desulfopila sp.]|jgi:hypothetical protein|nr:hypothetical protein [Desulfopila sp.]